VALGQRANDNTSPTRVDTRFDYSAPAEIFMMRKRSARGQAAGYRRFSTAAEAIHFAVEEIPGPLLIGVVMEVREERFDHKGIRELYARDDYPLKRGT